MNEETIAGVVGWGKTLRVFIATASPVNLPSPAISTAALAKGGRRTPFSAAESCTHRHHAAGRRRSAPGRLRRQAPSVTGNLWASGSVEAGWVNAMANRLSAWPDLPASSCAERPESATSPPGSAAKRSAVAGATAYQLEEIMHLPPDRFAPTGLTADQAGHPLQM